MGDLTLIGTVASVLGLGVSVWVLFVARSARDAARETRAWARRRSLADELNQAKQYIGQIGDFLHTQEWMAVRIRAHEVMTSCRESLSRWPDGLSEARRDDVLSASRLVYSIAEKAASPEANDFKPSDVKKLSATQLEAAGLISSALGEARNREERDGEE
jgi:hypothetical protein